MSIRHHIGDDTLMAYVNGTLTESISVVVATHLSICPHCRKSVEMMEEVAGLYMVESEPADLALSEAALMEQIARIPVEKEAKKKKPTAQAVDKGVPLPLAERLPVPIDDIPWKKLVPGISHYPLSKSSTGRGKGALRLLKIAPGTPMPEHSHSGQELTMILSGSYIDDLGRFQAGDVADLDDETWHRPVADTDKDCICLIATDAPLKFSGFFSRLLQPMIGI